MTQIKDYVDKYKLQLITALDYDKDFVEDVKKWYKGISSYQSVEAAAVIYLFELNFTPYVPLKFFPTGRGAGYELKPVGRHHIDTIMESYYGDIEFWGNNAEGQFLLEVRFQFMDKTTEKKSDRIPCYLEIDITLDHDNSEHTILVNQGEAKCRIYSTVKPGINYTDGLAVKAIRGIPVQSGNFLIRRSK
jgi:hypothetical protein